MSASGAAASAPDSIAPVLCVGAVLWDIVGRTPREMRLGADQPGRIVRIPGGVALNIAMALRRAGLRADLLGAVGRDFEGDGLIAACAKLGLGTEHLYRSEDLATDTYMAIEGAGDLTAAIADVHSLEQAGDKILRPLADGTLGDAHAPFTGVVALDGNLTEALLAEIAQSPLFARADLRIAPASPGKAERLLPLLDHPSAVLYVNLEEAGLLCQARFDSARAAAAALASRGAGRILVTDGGGETAEARDGNIICASPPKVTVARVTGAGDTFMAAHIAAELAGADRGVALERALAAAAAYVSGETAGA